MDAMRRLTRQIIDDERGLSTLERFGLFAAILAILVFSLTFVGGLSAASLPKGIIAALLGILAATVGLEIETGLPRLLKEVLPVGMTGLVIAAYFSAIMSTADSCLLASVGNFINDIYQKYINKGADAKRQVLIGRLATAVIAIFACLIAPLPGRFEGVFNYIQEIWGFISPGIVAAFLVGLLLPTPPRLARRPCSTFTPTGAPPAGC